MQHKPKYKGKGKLTETMCKRLTAGARCAIKMRSKESDKKQGAELLRLDLRNSPLHCFSFPTNCSTHYCKVAQATANPQPVDGFGSPATSSTSTAQLPDCDDSSITDEMCISVVVDEELRAWTDAMNEEDLDVVRSTPVQPSMVLDAEMLCDIQQLLSRLIARAPQLLGIGEKDNMHGNKGSSLLGKRIICMVSKAVD